MNLFDDNENHKLNIEEGNYFVSTKRGGCLICRYEYNDIEHRWGFFYYDYEDVPHYVDCVKSIIPLTIPKVFNY